MKGSRQGESRTEKQWHTRLEAQPLHHERLHDKLTFLFELRHTMRPNVRVAAQ